MYCSNCGFKNDESKNYCSNCGNLLNHNMENNTSLGNSGGIRKTIKKDIKSIKKGSFILTTFIFFIIIGLIQIAMNFSVDSKIILQIGKISYSIYDIILMLLLIFVTSFLCFAISTSTLDLIRGKNVKFGEVFSKPFKKIGNVFLYFICIIFFFLIYFLISYFCIKIPALSILFILLLVLYVYFLPALDVLLCLYADDNYEKVSIGETFRKALDITKGHRIEYYGMMFSFLPWCLLSILTLGILYIWLFPYIRMSYTKMYLNWTKESEIKTNENAIGNGAVIALGLGGIIITFIVIFVILFVLLFSVMTSLSNDNYKTIDDIFNKNNKIETKESTDNSEVAPKYLTLGDESKVTFVLPKGFTKSYGSSEGYGVFSDNEFNRISYLYHYSNSNETYKEGVKNNKEYRLDNYKYEFNEYSTEINGKEVKYYISKRTSEYNYSYYELFAVYPVDNNNSVEIEVSLTNDVINKDDITNYVIIK